jgi:hypothetical protein
LTVVVALAPSAGGFANCAVIGITGRAPIFV